MGRRSFHETLKNFLIELGKEGGYRAYSGDSEPLDVRIKQSRVEYKPDVIWKKGEEAVTFLKLLSRKTGERS